MPGVNRGARKGEAVAASYKIPVVLLIYSQKEKDPLSFAIWIFRNGQPDRDDDRIITVAII